MGFWEDEFGRKRDNIWKKCDKVASTIGNYTSLSAQEYRVEPFLKDDRKEELSILTPWRVFD
jgi:hypothetical protein